MTGPARVWIEADGGSRGNPGPAAYGAVLVDADTGAVLAERGETIGVASNNVAEYRGLIAGLELAAEHAPGAVVEARMDSKLVVEQMSGRWKIKHPDMRDLAARAGALAPGTTTYTWVPRADNARADALVNAALDGVPTGSTATETTAEPDAAPAQGWSATATAVTTLVLVRHGVTAHTSGKKFSGGLTGADPGLTEEGRDQIRATGAWLAPLAGSVDALVTSPVRRTRESAEILAALLDHEAEVEDGIAEMDFGGWDGLSFAEVQERHPDDLTAWLGSLDTAPGRTGESFRSVQTRVLAARDRLLEAHDGRTIVLVSHVTPIKTLVADALGAPLEALYKMGLSPASVTVIAYYPETPQGRPALPSLRLFNGRPADGPF